MFEKLAHLLIPRHSNNHKAKVLQPKGLLVIIGVLVILQGLVVLSPRYQRFEKVLGYAANISVDQVVSLTNQQRALSGLAPLQFNQDLANAAHLKGEHMLAHDYWAHVAPDGTEPWNFFRNVNYRYRYAGENLARDFSDAPSAVDAWMASPTHKENILSDHYNEIGVAVVEGDLSGVDTTIIVQFFGRKLNETVPIATVNEEKTLDNLTNNEEGPQVLPEETKVAANVSENKNQQVLVSPFSVSRGISLSVIGFLVAVFIIDLLIIMRRKIVRISSKNFAHIAFLGMILTILVIAKAGQIL